MTFLPNDRVIYTPTNEVGTVSSVNEKFVFVRFDDQVAKHGWFGATSQACRHSDLAKDHGVPVE